MRHDLARLYRNPNAATYQVLRQALAERGWEHRRTRGSHEIWALRGFAKVVVLPTGVRKSGTKRSLLKVMQEAGG